MEVERTCESNFPNESLASDTDRVWLRRTGVEKTPRRPRIIMEGPLVSDTTEVLSGAAPASEEPPIGHPAAEPAGAAPRSSSRSGGGGDLSKLLVSDLQRIAQELGISGTGRMRKGDLVAAIQERTGGGRSTARSASPTATRGTSAGADAPRPLNQDAMEADTSVRSGIGVSTPAAAGGGIGDAPVSAGHSGVGEAERTVSVAAQQAAPSVESHSGAAVAVEPSAEAGTESQGQEPQGQEGRRDRNRNRRRDDQGGNGRDQRRERSDNRENRENRESAAGNGRNGQNAQAGNAGGNRSDNRQDNRAAPRPDNRSDTRQDNRQDNRSDSRQDSRSDNRPDNRSDDDD